MYESRILNGQFLGRRVNTEHNGNTAIELVISNSEYVKTYFNDRIVIFIRVRCSYINELWRRV